MKKNLLKSTLAFFTAAALLFCTAYAEIGSITVKDTEVTVTGETDADSVYTVTVFKPGFEKTEALDDERAALVTAYMGQADSGSSGDFTYRLLMRSGLASGVYVVRVTPMNGSPMWSEFSYLNEIDAAKAVADLNGAASASDLKSLIELYQPYMTIDFSGTYSALENQDAVFPKMMIQKTENPYASLTDAAESFCKSVFLEAFYETGSDTLLSDNASLLGLDLNVYNMLSNHSSVLGTLKGKAYNTAEDFADDFDTNVGLDAFGSLSRSNMEYLLDFYSDRLTFPSAYASLDDAGKRELYKALEAYDSFSSFNAVSDAIKTFTDSLGSSTGSGSTGSGGTVSGGGSFVSGGGSYGIGGSISGTVTATPTDSSVGNTSPIEEPYFSDIDGVDWAQEAIIYLAGRKVLTGVGDGLFEPDRNVTREEFVKMLVIAFDITASDSVTEFVDVPAGEWYAPYIAAAASAGVVNGISANSFGTGEYITREDMAVMLMRTATQKEIALTSVNKRTVFNDAEAISDYAIDAVETLHNNQIINGVGGDMFAPKENATRAMAAKLVYELSKYKN